MQNESLIIMVGGASSRMKKSLETADLEESVKTIAKEQHKSLIPLGKAGKPLLHYLIQNAANAGYMEVYLVTGYTNMGFKDLVGKKDYDNTYLNLSVHFAVQTIPEGRQRPMGTADALQQCLDQYPELKNRIFTVCNGDNLYSKEALQDLREEREAPNALISYGSTGLRFSDDRISKFALMDISDKGFLKGIIEKPELEDLDMFRDSEGELRVSMNIFSFFGKSIYPYLVKCPIHSIRGEKELPEAVRNLVTDNPNSMICYPRSEHIPDLTNAEDINIFFK
ncbi:glucose-1-phosphate thymidylyltransferase [Flagellimonas aquimarina]|uniref:Glucose-1-phosphate thymidylyltransferase n=1 Tax=Flagellimonas aquimarina TaxID=2201895 RepID=A0A316KZY7_9FLAO|nr:sugar phosphate nucleotidyltransferase [Allomuricauda koreensis]PWL37463.1 glucose-1-phosphate thymidylyltransferase [Allomuricauda koreensis]